MELRSPLPYSLPAIDSVSDSHMICSFFSALVVLLNEESECEAEIIIRRRENDNEEEISHGVC